MPLEKNRGNGGEEGASASVYVDRSASMAGYLSGATQFERPFQDLVGSLPGTLRDIGASSAYRPFGLTVEDPADDRRPFVQPGYFVCRHKGDAGCETRLDRVFARIAETPDEVAVVLTDLWFDNSVEQTSHLTALQPLLATILGSGRAVAVYGIDAPFKGKIYDLPVSESKTRAIDYQGRHPLFMIVIGSKAQVLGFGEQLGRSGSPFLSNGLASGKIKRSIFTVDPGPEQPRDKEPLKAGENAQLRPQTFEAFGDAVIQQFVLGSARMPRPGAPTTKGPTWTAPGDDAFVTDAVWEGPMVPQVALWRRRDDKCTDSSWIPLGSWDVPWEEVGNGKRRFSLDPGAFYARVRRQGVYTLVGELRRASVTSPNPANSWMAAWSLQPERAAAVAGSPPPLFPTLNLSEVARHLENALATAAERKGGGIVGFSVAVKVEG